MMVPLADFMNHLPIDTQFGVYDKLSHSVKNTVLSGESRKAEEKKEQEDFQGVDYSLVYSQNPTDKAFLEDLDPLWQ
jgi:hypothetical protein